MNLDGNRRHERRVMKMMRKAMQSGARWMAVAMLALVLAGCEGDAAKQEALLVVGPAPGSDPKMPIVAGLDKPAMLMSAPIAESRFFSVSSTASPSYHIWVTPRPSATWNDPQFQVFSDPAFMTWMGTSNPPCSWWCGPDSAEFLALLAFPNVWFMVYSQSPGQSHLDYGVSVLTGTAVGTYAGTGNPTVSPGTLVSPGTRIDGTFVTAGTTHYYQIPASKPGIHALKVNNTVATFYYMDVFQDSAVTMTIGRCRGGLSDPVTSSCVVNVPVAPATFYVTVRDSGVLGGNYTLSVIGP
jgi:hypothetical protein